MTHPLIINWTPTFSTKQKKLDTNWLKCQHLTFLASWFFRQLGLDVDRIGRIRIRCNTQSITPDAIHLPLSHNFFFLHFIFKIFTFYFLLLLTFLLTFFNQQLRLKVVFCNYQSQPLIAISSGATPQVLHRIQIPHRTTHF